MTLVLDTNAYSALMRGDTRVATLLEQAGDVLVPATVAGELFAGFVQGSRWAENWQVFQRFLAQPGISLYAPQMEDSIRYGQIVKDLRDKGSPIPANDIWIAASALVHNAAVLTRDKHYHQIPGLLVMEY